MHLSPNTRGPWQGHPLTQIAQQIPIHTIRNRSVFYAEDIGRVLAEEFVKRHSGFHRLDDLVKSTPQGKAFWKEIDGRSKLRWHEVKNVWAILSLRYAALSSGDVHCFVPWRLIQERDVEEARSKFGRRRSFADTHFEKFELPELSLQPRIEKIYLHDQQRRIFVENADGEMVELNDPRVPR